MTFTRVTSAAALLLLLGRSPGRAESTDPGAAARRAALERQIEAQLERVESRLAALGARASGTFQLEDLDRRAASQNVSLARRFLRMKELPSAQQRADRAEALLGPEPDDEVQR